MTAPSPAQLVQATTRIAVVTRPRALHDITATIDAWIAGTGIGDGLVTILLRHTSASLTIQENASPEVGPDLVDALDRLAPRGAPWRHDLEGDDDMPAHVKTTLTGVTLSIPVADGRMDLGTWQGIHVIEHRDHGHRRELSLHLLGTRLRRSGS